MEDAGTSEEDDDIDSQDSNTLIDHGHLARNCSIKIITPAVKALASFTSCRILATYLKLSWEIIYEILSRKYRRDMSVYGL